MRLFTFNKVWPYLTVLGAAVVLLWSVMAGFKAGSLRAQAAFAAAQSEQAGKALDFFYNDFGRFPETQEFFDYKTMSPYFSAFPLAQPSGGGCDKTIQYRLTDSRKYQLGVCSPVDSAGMRAGWNIIYYGK